MKISDVIKHGSIELLEKNLFECMLQGARISKIEGLTDEDERILKDHYIKQFRKHIYDSIDYDLKNNIPAFDRLCWSCEGVLDCESDHK